ncbi:MAG: TRAM domain-containing protein, partial [Anaerolineales bacterium]|nr:TRAM domain-containing protein [Anaerolineales bacterium]
EITLEKLTYGGEALGRLSDGRAVFVPFGLPNEVVKIKLTQEKQNFARWRNLLKLLNHHLKELKQNVNTSLIPFSQRKKG